MTDLDATLDLFHLFGDPTRVRLASVLAGHPLTVAEMTAVTQLAQSRVSTHLGKLTEAGVLARRRAGASTVYALNDAAMPDEARRIWSVVEERTGDGVFQEDRRRAEAIVRARERAAWPEAVAGRMERHYSPGRTWEATARACVGLVRLGDVLDAGSGDGAIADLLVPRARSYTCLDKSDRVIAAARERLRRKGSVRFVVGDVEALPFGAPRFDEVLLLNVLASVPAPARAVAEAARVLRPGGRLVVVTLAAHRRLDVTAAYGHVHGGFRPAVLRGFLARAGLRVDRCDVAFRERRPPHFQVVIAVAGKAGRAEVRHASR